MFIKNRWSSPRVGLLNRVLFHLHMALSTSRSMSLVLRCQMVGHSCHRPTWSDFILRSTSITSCVLFTWNIPQYTDTPYNHHQDLILVLHTLYFHSQMRMVRLTQPGQGNPHKSRTFPHIMTGKWPHHIRSTPINFPTLIAWILLSRIPFGLRLMTALHPGKYQTNHLHEFYLWRIPVMAHQQVGSGWASLLFITLSTSLDVKIQRFNRPCLARVLRMIGNRSCSVWKRHWMRLRSEQDDVWYVNLNTFPCTEVHDINSTYIYYRG